MRYKSATLWRVSFTISMFPAMVCIFLLTRSHVWTPAAAHVTQKVHVTSEKGSLSEATLTPQPRKLGESRGVPNWKVQGKGSQRGWLHTHSPEEAGTKLQGQLLPGLGLVFTRNPGSAAARITGHWPGRIGTDPTGEQGLLGSPQLLLLLCLLQ